MEVAQSVAPLDATQPVESPTVCSTTENMSGSDAGSSLGVTCKFFYLASNSLTLLNYLIFTTVDQIATSISFTFFTDMKEKVKIPPSWHWIYDAASKFAFCINLRNAVDGQLVHKSLRVMSTSTVSFHMGGRTVSFPNADGSYNSFDSLSNLITKLDRSEVCKGILNDALSNVNITGKYSVLRYGKVLRSKKCSFISQGHSQNVLCKHCALSLKYLKKRAMTSKNLAISKRKLDITNQKLRRMKSRESVRLY